MLKKILYTIPFLLIGIVIQAQSEYNQATNFSGVVGFTADGAGNYTSTISEWNQTMLTSGNIIASNMDGGVEYIVGSSAGAVIQDIAVGLSTSISTINVGEINYRMLIGEEATLSLWIGNEFIGSYGSVEEFDELRIARIEDQIVFTKNGVELHTEITSATEILYVKASTRYSNITLASALFKGDYYEPMELFMSL